MPRVLSAIISLFLSLLLNAQSKLADSLEKLLGSAGEDSNKVKILDDLSWELSMSDADKSIHFAEQQKNLAAKIGYVKGEANAWSNLGNANYLKGNYKEAITQHQKAALLRKQIKDYARSAGSLNNIGSCYQLLGNYQNAISHYIQALRIFESLGDKQRIALITSNVAGIYIELKQFAPALRYAQQSIDGWKGLNNPQGLSNTLVTLGNAYRLNRMEKQAIEAYEKALELQKDIGNKVSLGRIYHNLGTVYLDQKDYEKAMRHIELEIRMKESVNDREGIASAHYNLGHAYALLKKPDAAIKEFRKCLETARSIGNLDNVRWAYAGLKEAYSSKKEFEKAFLYASLYDGVKDTILDQQASRQIAEAQTRYETARKERENAELKRKTEVQKLEIENETQKRKAQLAIGLALFGVVGFSSLYLYNRKKMRHKAEHAAAMATEEKKRFRAVIEAEEKERSRIAQELHDGLGQLLSTARLNVAGLEDSVATEDKEWLDRSLKVIDEACHEVRSISHNMMPSALIRLGLVPALNELVQSVNASRCINLQFDADVQGAFGAAVDISVYRIVQEVLNNMIRHAAATKITLRIKEDRDVLHVQLSDNGAGFDISKISESQGIGWKNIFSRVSMLEGDIKIESAPGQGSSVAIRIKLKR